MCTFKIANFLTNNQLHDQHLQLGGPTTSRTVNINGITVIHNLLSITGKVTPQPVQVDHRYFMLIGEIYNYDTCLPSDIYFGIEQYLAHGNNFTQQLDGEFLFIVFDSRTMTVDFFSDPWGTRQVFYYHHGDNFCFSSLPIEEPGSTPQFRFTHYTQVNDAGLSQLYQEQAPGWQDHNCRLKPNSHYRYHITQGRLQMITDQLHQWDIAQCTDNLHGVTQAFEAAVLKRHTARSVLFLSGGVDSACVAACLADHGRSFDSMTIQLDDWEDERSLTSILDYTQGHNRNHIIRQAGTVSADNIRCRQLLTDRRCVDDLSVHQSIIREQAIELYGSNVILTANGADEVLDNYRAKSMSEFDIWPKNLNDVFPWNHFCAGSARRLIDYHETISLAYGLEQRSVFYDKQLVQAWLNTTAEIKNQEPKVFLRHYLRARGIYITSRVVGFQAARLKKYGIVRPEIAVN